MPQESAFSRFRRHWRWPEDPRLPARDLRPFHRKNSTCLGINGLAEVRRIVAINKLHVDTKREEDVIELRVGTFVEIASGNEFAPCLRQVDDRVKHRTSATGETQTRHYIGAFEQRNALSEHVSRQVHQTGIDVSQFPHHEQIRGMLGAF